MLKIFSFIILLLSALLSQAVAALPAVDIAKPHYQVGHAISFYEDTQSEINFEQITSLPAELFQPQKNEISTHFFTQSTFYYKFDILNQSSLTVNRLLVFETPWLDSIKVKVLSPDNTIKDYTTGNTYPFSQRAAEHTQPNIEHEFQSGVSTVYVQVQTRDPFIVPISVVDRETLYKTRISDLSLTTFIYGMILAMVFYHLILFVSTRLRYYAYYVLYLSAFLVANASYNGYSYQFLFSEQPNFQNWLQSTAIFLFCIAGLLFAKSFLNLNKYLPSVYKSINGLILIFIGTLIISAFFGYHVHIILSISMSVLFSVYLFYIALLSMLKGNRTAKFFLFGTTAGLIGTAITALTVMAIIPYSYLGYRAIDFGMVIDSILLSLALVDRVKINEKERKIAENAAKTDALTGLLNRRAYDEICLHQETQLNKIYHDKFSIMMLDLDYFKAVNDNYGHPAGDVVLQRVARLLQYSIKSSDYVFRFGGEEFLILLPDTEQSHAKATAERIRAAIENMSIIYEGTPIKITISIGLAEQDVKDNTIHNVQHLADSALYRAKQSGRNKVVLAN